MTFDEAKKIATIIELADSGCIDCVGRLAAGLDEAFPAFTWTLLDWYKPDQRVEAQKND